tara:strand:- start:47 stop:463 length:417 start_codon:yes stop_codon:yes gene_type:complete
MTKELILTTEIENQIVNQLMTGVPLSKICKDQKMPSLSKVYNWLKTNKEFSKNLLQARRIGAQSYIDSAIEELEKADNKNIMVVREKLQMCRWMASKLIPIYGDKQQIIQDTKIEISWNTQDPDLKNVTNGSVLSMNK